MVIPLLNLTRATLRSPEFGFLGPVVYTLVQTPFMAGRLTSAGDVARRAFWPCLHPRRTWLYVAFWIGEDEKTRVIGVGTRVLALGPESGVARSCVAGRRGRVCRRRRKRQFGILMVGWALFLVVP